MKLSPMRFKNFIWPHNPRVYSITYERKMAANKIPFGRHALQSLGQTRRVFRGEGEFVGEGAYNTFKRLATVFYEETPGLLIHPLWQAANAYFVSLRLEQEPRPDYVRYSFTFWEDDSWYTALAKQDRTAIPGQGENREQKQYHKVVRGDTLWALARAYGLSLEELIALNPQIKNPNLIRVGDEVRVR